MVGLAIAIFAAAVPAAHAGKEADRFVGGPVLPEFSNSIERNDYPYAEGEFRAIGPVAVNESTGQIYAADLGARRVSRFDAAGNFELMWGDDVVPGGTAGPEICTSDCGPGDRTGALGGQFNSPTGIAVDPSDGSVYVMDKAVAIGTDDGIKELGGRVQKFAADGNFVLTFGKGVNKTTGGDVCTAASGDECGAGSVGSAPGEFGDWTSGGSYFGQLAVDPNPPHDVFVADPGENSRVMRFAADGTFIESFGTQGSGTGEFRRGPEAITVDTAGIVYAAESNGSLFHEPLPAPEIERYDTSSGTFLDPIPASASSLGDPGEIRGLAVDRSSGGGDPERLLVARSDRSGPASAPGDNVIEEYESPGEPVPPASPADVHGAGGNFGRNFGRGLAFNTASGELFVGVPFGSEGIGTGFFVLDDDGTGYSSSASVAGATNVEARSANLAGTVDPDQSRAYYRFEYSRSGTDFTAAAGWAPVSGAGTHEVLSSLDGLDPNTTYRFRLAVVKPSGPFEWAEVRSPEGTLLTDAIPPDVETGSTHAYGDTFASVQAKVNPNGSPTTYRIEYGPGDDFAFQAPIPAGSAGSATTTQTILERLDGLEPETTYRYRVIAENSEGEVAGAVRTFRTRPAHEFAERAYEQVSPVDKNDTDVAGPESVGNQARHVAPDGSVVLFGGTAGTALPKSKNAPTLGYSGQYRAVRGDDDWDYETLGPRQITPDLANQTPALGGSPTWSKMVLDWNKGSLNEANTPSFNLYDAASGEAVEIGIAGELTRTAEFNWFNFGGASEGFDRVLFDSIWQLTDDPGQPPEAEAHRVYMWTEGPGGGTKELVSRDASGEPTGSAVVGGAVRRRGALSDSGEHAFFSTPVTYDTSNDTSTSTGETRIYRRSNGETTALASPWKRSTPDPEGPKAKEFFSISADGERVFFTSSEELTDVSNTGPTRRGTALYRYDFPTDTLTDVSVDDDTEDGGRVQLVLATSEDGAVAYFLARGKVAGQGKPGVDKLYRWEDDGTASGKVTLVAELGEDSAGHEEFRPESLWMTPDGGALLFSAQTNLTGYRDNGFRQLYLYEAEAEALSCISCRPNLTRAQSDAVLGVGSSGGRSVGAAMSEDGRRIAFRSAEPLLAADTNGSADVYLWEGGHLQLLTPGDSEARGVRLMGMSASGDDVFFFTSSRLVGQDRDDYVDLYTARVGGGIPSQNPEPVEPCEGEECRGPAPPAPEPPSPESTGETGGNVVEPPPSPRCERLTARAERLTNRTKRLRERTKRNRQRAKRAARRGNRTKARKLPRRAQRTRRQAKKTSRRASRIGRRAAAACGAGRSGR